MAGLIWNGAAYGKQPSLPPPLPKHIVHASVLEDVVSAVQYAVHHDLKVAVRCGGHHQGMVSLAANGLVLDVSALKVGVQPKILQ